MQFKASFDTTVRVVTTSTIVLFVFVGYTVIANNGYTWAAVCAVAVMFVVLAACYLFHPQGYVVTDKQVIVRRLVGNIVIPKAALVAYKQVANEQMKWAVRTFGVGGLFGYFGKFVNREFGSMTMYVTQKRNFILLQTGTGKVVLTPDAPAQFLTALG